MLGFLVFCLGTSVTSFCMQMATGLRMFKDTADVGYKIDTKKFSEISAQLNPDAQKKSFLIMLIPGYNLWKAFEAAAQYNVSRPTLLDQLRVMDVLEEMTDLEKEEYIKRPTALNAIIAPLKVEIRLQKAASVKIDNENEKSEIYYEIGESLNDITILKVTGDASKLPKEEQKKKIINTWLSVIEKGKEEYGNKENFAKALSNSLGNKTDLDLNKKDKMEEEIVSNPTEVSISEQKQALENMKNELLQENNLKQQKENNKKLLKRRNRRK